MTKLFALFGIMLLALALGMEASGRLRVAEAATVDVDAADFSFIPETETISVGDTVVWTNTGATVHNVLTTGGPFNSPNLAPGATYSFDFSTAGSYDYYCSFHSTGPGNGMSGTVIVQQEATVTASATSAAGSATATRTRTATASASATRTTTPGASTETPIPLVTATPPAAGPSPTPVSPPVVAPGSPVQPGGGAAGAGVRPPATGSGPGSSQDDAWTLALAVAGAALLAASASVSWRSRRRPDS